MTLRFCCAVLLMTAASLTAGCATTPQNLQPVEAAPVQSSLPVPQNSLEPVAGSPTLNTAPGSDGISSATQHKPTTAVRATEQPDYIHIPAPRDQLNSVQRLDQLKTARLEAESRSAVHSPAIEPPHPTVAPPPKRTAPPLTLYTVGTGENLYGIAAKPAVFNEGLLWPLIYRANRDQIKDPQQIFPGQQLTIPRNVSDSEKESARETARQSGIFLP